MKIIHLCLSAFFIDNYSYQENMLSKYHVKQGHDVTVIASLFSYDNNGKAITLPGPSKYKDPNGYKIIRLSYKKPIKWNRLFRHYIGLEDNLIAIEPDIIFIHGTSFGDITIVKRYIKRHPKVKLFADSHADFINSGKNWLSLHILHKIVWRYYTKTIEPYLVKCYGVTPLRCRFLHEVYGVNLSIIEYLPLGVDDDLIPEDRYKTRIDLRKELRIKDSDFLIFTGGKVDRRKNIHILLEAIDNICNPEVHVVICGVLTQEMEYLKEKIEANPNIHYLGWCDAERVMNCMIASDIACFPGTHSTLWEQSVGVGLPAIFKQWDEMEHVNVNGNCQLIKGGSVDELEVIIRELASKGERFTQLQKFASIASNKFLYSEISKKAINC